MSDFELGAKQKDTLRWFVSNETFLFMSGAVRSGKSFIMDLGWLIWTQGNFPQPQHFIMAGHSVPGLIRNIVPDMEKLANLLGMSWRYVRDGSYIQCGAHRYHMFGSSDRDAVDKVRGMTAAGAYMDEMVLMDPDFVSMAITRMSVPGAKMIGSMNPGNPGHFIKVEYIDRCGHGINGRNVPYGLDDNPSLSDEYKAMIKSTLTGVDYERLIEGKWVANTGLIYPSWTYKDKDVKPRRWCIALDYANSGTLAILLIGVGRNDLAHVFDESYHIGTVTDSGNVLHSKQKNDEEIIEQVEDLLTVHGLDKSDVSVLPDPSAASLKRSMRLKGWNVRSANNDVLEGIRVTNVALARGYLTVGTRCKKLRREMQTYIWDDKAAERGEDKPLKTDKHHGVDALRYFGLKTYAYLLTQYQGPILKPEGF